MQRLVWLIFGTATTLANHWFDFSKRWLDNKKLIQCMEISRVHNWVGIAVVHMYDYVPINSFIPTYIRL